MNRKCLIRIDIPGVKILLVLPDMCIDSTVPVGTPVEFKEIDILHIGLKTRLFFNAMSSAGWIVLVRQLG